MGKTNMINNKVKDKLEIKYGLPKDVVYCTKCVYSNQRPSSTVEFKNNKDQLKTTLLFDDEGVCNACKWAEMKDKVIDWEEKEYELRKLCDKHRSNNGNYDCIVPGSGGKDSTFTAHILKYKYNMNPLTVTWAPHVYTDVGFNNFQKWIHSGLDNILTTPNGKLHRLLTKLAFENLVHPFQPFIIGQRHVAPKASAMYGVPLVFYGDNPAEWGNNIEDNFIPTMDRKYFEGDQDISKLILGGIPGDILVKDYGINEGELLPYLPAEKEKLRRVGTEVHYLSYYIKWDSQECYYYSVEHTGFEVNTERTEGTYSKYSGIDDRIDPLHYYTTFIKYGLGRASYDAAQEIRNSKIDREEGIALVKRYDSEVPRKYLTEMLDYMNLNEKRFWEIIDNARSPHLWDKNADGWFLRHPIWKNEDGK
jgi:N-acetyl sugar amidotransferase